MSTTVAPVAAPPKAMEKIRRALVGGHPLVYVQSWEEPRGGGRVRDFWN
jgi:hypothetical protein